MIGGGGGGLNSPSRKGLPECTTGLVGRHFSLLTVVRRPSPVKPSGLSYPSVAGPHAEHPGISSPTLNPPERD